MPFGPAVVPAQTNIGVAVGVSLGVAVGVALGVGLGVSAALSGIFAAAGVVQFSVPNVEEFTNNPEVQPLGMLILRLENDTTKLSMSKSQLEALHIHLLNVIVQTPFLNGE